MANSDREVLVSIPLSKEAIKSFSEFGASRNKKKQLLHWFLEKTGFGKSLIFQRLVPKKEIMTRKPSTVVIVCPLQGIVYDQMEEASSMGLTAAMLTDCCLEEIECGKYNLVFASAEEVLAKPFLSSMKRAATPFHQNMCAIIVCNHCVQSNAVKPEGTENSHLIQENFVRKTSELVRIYAPPICFQISSIRQTQVTLTW